MPLELSVLPARFAVCRLDAGAEPPAWASRGRFSSVSRTADETSIVCEDGFVPDGVQADRGWRALKAAGPLDFGLTGVLLAIAAPLAAAGVSLFAVSTYDTDYVLVKDAALETALAALRSAGHGVSVFEPSAHVGHPAPGRPIHEGDHISGS